MVEGQQENLKLFCKKQMVIIKETKKEQAAGEKECWNYDSGNYMLFFFCHSGLYQSMAASAFDLYSWRFPDKLFYFIRIQMNRAFNQLRHIVREQV